MNLPSLKKRSKKVYISLSLYLLTTLFIIISSILPGGYSALESGFISNIGSFFINLFGGNKTLTTVEATSLVLASDSSFIKEKNIVTGTSSRLIFEAHYPEGNSFEQSYEIKRNEKDDDAYDIVVSNGLLNDKVYYLTLNVVGYQIGEYSFTVSFNEDASYTYDFKVIDLPAPISFEVDVPSSLKVNESLPLNLLLTDPTNKVLDRVDTSNMTNEEKKKAIDLYLRRIYDPNKLEVTCSNNLSITSDLVITGLKEGPASLTIGDNTYNLIVEGTTDKPTKDWDISSTGVSYINDYDYVLNEDVGTIITSNFEGTTCFNVKGVSDPLAIRTKRLSDNSLAIYGYRTEGVVTVEAYSPFDHNDKREITIEVKEAIPTSLTLNYKSLEVSVGSYLYITSVTKPIQSSSLIRIVDVENPSILEVSETPSNVLAVKGKETGTTKITIESVLNPSLKETLTIKVNKRLIINEDNEGDFHHLVRKFIGHFSLFLVNGVLASLFFMFYFEKNDKKNLLSVGASSLSIILLSIITELLQFLSPGRGPAVEDVLLDIFGGVVGILVVIIIFMIIQLFKKKKEK